VNLLQGEHGRKGVVILDGDLGKHLSIGLSEEPDAEYAGRRAGLADGFGPPELFELDEQEVIAELSFSDRGRIAGEVLVNEPDLANTSAG
jgi:hypothetical protein